MNKALINAVEDFVIANIEFFHNARIDKLKQLKLEDLLKRKKDHIFVTKLEKYA